jgi:cobalt-zinc-cadmium efflux system protein
MKTTMAEHSHSHFGDLSKQTNFRLIMSLCLTLAFVVVEVVAGVVSNSLALLTDAAHNATDVVALALTWYAFRITVRPANARKTFGYHRVGILIALINSTSLVLISLGIFYEAYHRLLAPPEVNSSILISVGTLAFLINAVTAWLVHKGSRHDLNLRSAFLHLLGDVLSTIGAVIAGIVIAFTGLNWLDPLVSILIGGLILWNAWIILRETLDILLEATPGNIDISVVIRDLLQLEGVRGVHDLHIWSITQSLRSMSAHILVNDITVGAGVVIQQDIKELLRHKYGISHVTVQLECTGCEPDELYCNLEEMHHHHHSHGECSAEDEA